MSDPKFTKTTTTTEVHQTRPGPHPTTTSYTATATQTSAPVVAAPALQQQQPLAPQQHHATFAPSSGYNSTASAPPAPAHYSAPPPAPAHYAAPAPAYTAPAAPAYRATTTTSTASTAAPLHTQSTSDAWRHEPLPANQQPGRMIGTDAEHPVSVAAVKETRTTTDTVAPTTSTSSTWAATDRDNRDNRTWSTTDRDYRDEREPARLHQTEELGDRRAGNTTKIQHAGDVIGATFKSLGDKMKHVGHEDMSTDIRAKTEEKEAKRELKLARERRDEAEEVNQQANLGGHDNIGAAATSAAISDELRAEQKLREARAVQGKATIVEHEFDRDGDHTKDDHHINVTGSPEKQKKHGSKDHRKEAKGVH